MTQEQFSEAIAAAAKAAVEGVLASQAKATVATVDASPEEQFDAQKKAALGAPRPGPEPTYVKNCPSVTGATFTAKIDHRGKVTELLDYECPTGVDALVTEGGIVPSGYRIGGNEHAHWKWSSFWQADINAFVGKPLPAHVKAAADAATARDGVAA
jgi:hypothetical protein